MKYILTLYYDHWCLKMLVENASSLWVFLKYEQQPCKAGTHRNYSKLTLSKSVNSGLKICLQIPPGQSFVSVLARAFRVAKQNSLHDRN